MEQEEQINREACLYCGSMEFIWGTLVNPRGRIAFRPDGPFFTIVSTDEALKVRKCDGCGNIQSFVED